MMKVSSSKRIFSLKPGWGPVAKLLVVATLLLAAGVGAQTPSDASGKLPEGARVNKDKCLGYEMDYKKYPKPVIAKVQADMYQLYHQDADWKHDAGLKGKPLNDGILGPITWSWMQRFCKSFALDINTDVVSAFPARADEVAKFSATFNDDAATLISKPFAQWSASHHSACNLDVQETLAHGSDEQLQALVRCYLEGEQKAPEVQPAVAAEPIQPYMLYVLREDDFAAMAEASASAKITAKAIETLKGKEFPSRADVQAEIAKLLAGLSEAETKQLGDALLAQFQTKTRYELSDQVLNTLNQQGISDALFAALQALPQKSFADLSALTKAINAAVASVNKNASAQVNTPAPQDAASANSQAVSSAPAPEVVNAERLVLQVQLLARQDYWIAADINASQLPLAQGPVAAPVIELLQDLKDREYPEGQLLHMAAKNKILKAADICKQDKSNAIDKSLAKPNIAEIKQYLQSVIQSGDLTDKYCTENFYRKLNDYYDKNLKATIDKLYSEPMPAYKHQPINWSGASKDCGCVPDEIQTMAYGIFPYWETTETPLEFDFSTFSRTAYFGLTIGNSGKLQQINSLGVDLLKDNSSSAKAFIREARRYGSKVDWILEKEFSAAPELENEAALQIFFSNLQADIINLLGTPLTDAESRLRPLLSLGLASQPRNGDGVTFYFKNYPNTASAKQKFDDFFNSLKDKLRQLDEERNSFHPVKDITYVNIMLTKSTFLSEEGTFNREHLDTLTNVEEWAEKNLSIVEVQDRVRTMLVLIMEDPYYTSLDEIYAVTTGIDRNIIAPLMFSDYSLMDTTTEHKGQSVDERKKRLAYVHESFGAGTFWPMVQYKNSSDGKDYREFNDYIGKHFSPGYTESFWNETLCAYRWQLIYVLNLWLLLAFIYLITFFYLFPHRCKDLPMLLRWLQHPLTVVGIILPPIVLWGYLLLMDSSFTLLNLSSLLCLLLLGLAITAGVDAVKALQQQKPNRNLLQYQKLATAPTSENTEVVGEEVDEEIYDNERT